MTLLDKGFPWIKGKGGINEKIEVLPFEIIIDCSLRVRSRILLKGNTDHVASESCTSDYSTTFGSFPKGINIHIILLN